MIARIRAIILITMIICVGWSNSWAKDDLETKQINNRVSQLIDLLKDQYASEYEAARKISIHTLDEYTKIAIAEFAIEGLMNGNSGSQYISVFYIFGDAKNDNRLPKFRLLDVMKVTGFRVEKVQSVSIKNLDVIITVNILEFVGSDPACCPSKKSQAIYKIAPTEGSRLQRINK
jgi:hypothetical protein